MLPRCEQRTKIRAVSEKLRKELGALAKTKSSTAYVVISNFDDTCFMVQVWQSSKFSELLDERK